MSARTKSLIRFRYKLLVGVLAFVVVGPMTGWMGDGKKDNDYSDLSRYRNVAFEVVWDQFANTTPVVDFVYNVGTSKGTDHTARSPFAINGYATQGERFSMVATVRDLENKRVTAFGCQAFVDGNPVFTERMGEPGKWLRCWAIASW
jgi:hypothetical protein